MNKVVIINASGTLIIGEMESVHGSVVHVKNPLLLVQQQQGQIALAPVPLAKPGEDLSMSVNYTFYYEAKDENIKKSYEEAVAQFFKGIQIAKPSDLEKLDATKAKLDETTLITE